MRRPSRKGLSWAFVLCANIPLIAQDLQSIGREKPFSFAGGLSISQVFYASRGIPSRRDPYNYFASGNVNLSLYGWAVPLNFSVSNKRTSFSQPFNQYALHPTWKWIAAHAGYTSMSFSPYTVNGHVFLGGGVDLAPEGRWKFSALYGRFLKAVEADTTGKSAALPSYERNGYGFKATYGAGRNVAELILFRARDEKNNALRIPDSLGITPQENLVVSVGGGKTVFKHFLLKAELATSAMTKDTRAEKTNHDHPLAKTGSLFTPTLSSSYYHAFKTSFDYQREAWVAGLAYERIDPGYRTLGAYYFNNDLENVTINIAGGMLQGKMNVAASAGVQRDNLDNTKVSIMRRMVSSINISYMPSQRLNLAASWSGFQTHTNIRSQFQSLNALSPFDNPDTLSFTQISRNATASTTYTLPGAETKRQNLHIHVSWQEAADHQGQMEQHSGTAFCNINTGYTLTLIPQNMGVALTFSATTNQGPFIDNRMIGPNAAINRSFFGRKLRTTMSSSWNKSFSNGEAVNTMLNIRLNGVVALQSKHNLQVSVVMATRTTSTEASRSFTEFTATAGYSYSFSKAKNTPARAAPRK
ncbi:MAG: hypothetical protein WA874_04155 [Chryseosolibacter sp.]